MTFTVLNPIGVKWAKGATKRDAKKAVVKKWHGLGQPRTWEELKRAGWRVVEE